MVRMRAVYRTVFANAVGHMAYDAPRVSRRRSWDAPETHQLGQFQRITRAEQLPKSSPGMSLLSLQPVSRVAHLYSTPRHLAGLQPLSIRIIVYAT